MQLLCPKCHNIMAQYERNRVLVDQCTECKGIFLDRGEFENLVEAEKAYYGTPVAAPSVPGDRPTDRAAAVRPHEERRYDERRNDQVRFDDHRYDERAHDDRSYEDRRYSRDGREDRPYRKKRRSSMLEELLDF